MILKKDLMEIVHTAKNKIDKNINVEFYKKVLNKAKFRLKFYFNFDDYDSDEWNSIKKIVDLNTVKQFLRN
jgi:hypothetical protein